MIEEAHLETGRPACEETDGQRRGEASEILSELRPGGVLQEDEGEDASLESNNCSNEEVDLHNLGHADKTRGLPVQLMN